MERITLTAPDGKYYTDGETYGKEIHLAVGLDGSDYCLIDESDLPDAEEYAEATEEDYLNALARLGVER